MAQESILLKQTINLLRPYCKRLIRVNGGVFRGAGGTRVKTYYLYGTDSELKNEVIPDLFGFLHNGKMLAIEIKSPDRGSNSVKRKREERQRRFIGTIKSVGGIGAVVESVADVMGLIKSIEENSRQNSEARFNSAIRLLGENFHDS